MRIAQLAPQVESVPPSGYGGTELIVSELTEELVSRGHEVTLFATHDSVTTARLVSCAPVALRMARVAPTRWPAYDLTALLRLERMAGEFDVIHNHIGYMALPLLRQLQGSRIKTVTTLHNPIKDYCSEIYLNCSELPFVAISKTYRRLNFPRELNYVATIYNGIDMSQFPFHRDTKRSFLLFMGRICRDKGTLQAIEIADRLGLPMVLAGKVDDSDKDYFESEIRPHLSKPDINYIGEVTGAEKSRLFSGAIATVCPIAFEEPFGLVLVESLACGTPVMALGRGAVTEIISDGETGVVGNSVDELVSRFSEIAHINSGKCRVRAETMFSKQTMTAKYEQLYRRLR